MRLGQSDRPLAASGREDRVTSWLLASWHAVPQGNPVPEVQRGQRAEGSAKGMTPSGQDRNQRPPRYEPDGLIILRTVSKLL